MQDVTATGGTIFLDPIVEACSASSSCATSCSVTPTTCSFTVPASAAPNTTYQVSVYDTASNSTKTGTLTVVAGSPSCAFASL
jgi:hypothetical protein